MVWFLGTIIQFMGSRFIFRTVEWWTYLIQIKHKDVQKWRGGWVSHSFLLKIIIIHYTPWDVSNFVCYVTFMPLFCSLVSWAENEYSVRQEQWYDMGVIATYEGEPSHPIHSGFVSFLWMMFAYVWGWWIAG